MKKIYFKHFLVTLLLLCSTVANAHDFEVDGIYYAIISSTNKTVKVTYAGYGYSSYEGEYSENIVIPESVTYDGADYRVISIGDYAFIDCPELTGVTIPESVTNIERCSFYKTGLITITIPNSVTRIGGWAFYGCDKLTNVTIGDGARSIGEDAFAGCASLKSVVIGASVEHVGDDAFGGCTALVDITFPNNFASIETLTNACSDTPWYETWYNSQPDGVVYIGNVLYKYKGEMPAGTTIKVKEGTTMIAAGAFSGCSGLENIEVPESVTSIGEDAFYRTYWYDSQPDGVVYVGNVLYKYKGEMPAGTTIEVRDGVTSIGGSAFSYCEGLTNITIPNSVTTIGESAFTYCEGLTNITIPGSVTSFGKYAFYGCYDLTSVITGDGVRIIGESAFMNCYNLVDINLPESICDIGEFAFCNTGLRVVVIPSSLDFIPYSAFEACRYLRSIVIPESVENVTDCAFYDCASNAKVYNPSLNITKSNGFYNVGTIIRNNIDIQDEFVFTAEVPYTLVDYVGTGSVVSLPENYNEEPYSIGNYAFFNCTGLTSVEIPNGVTSIGDRAFEDCFGLTSVTIGKNVTSIGYYAFDYCYGLKEIYVKADTPPSAYSYTFSGVNTNSATLYVPVGSKDAYAAANGWSKFYNIVEMEFTGIDEVVDEVKGENSKVKDVYDLSGRKVTNPTKGIYIVNGKKVLLK